MSGVVMDLDEKTMTVSEAIRKYDPQRPYTYADYVSWENDPRCELIDGEIVVMDAPSLNHQRISGELFRQLANYLFDKKCEVFAAPSDVCLFGLGDDDTTVVQPDVFVVCDESKIDEKRCNGAPDFIIEILSPSNAKHDKERKLNKYMKARVREYWIVDPVNKNVSVYIFNQEIPVIGYYECDEVIPVHILDDCKITLQDVFKRVV